MTDRTPLGSPSGKRLLVRLATAVALLIPLGNAWFGSSPLALLSVVVCTLIGKFNRSIIEPVLIHWIPLAQPKTEGGSNRNCAWLFIDETRAPFVAVALSERRAVTMYSIGLLTFARYAWLETNSGEVSIAWTIDFMLYPLSKYTVESL